MEIVKLKPAVKDYIWGGNKLRTYGKQSDSDRIAECWELSMHPDGISVIDSGKDKGKLLSEVLQKSDWGSRCAGFEFFPVLIKLIDASDNLSVQVHPSDDYALKFEGQYGKTEMWYVLDCEAGGGLYCGLKDKLTEEELKESLDGGSVLEKLNFFEVKKGDCFFIKAGTIHAIAKGVTIVEVQQNSNLTYRLYDYLRKDKEGNYRPLHIDKAMKVSDLEAYTAQESKKTEKLAECKYFTVYECKGEDIIIGEQDSFNAVTITAGKGFINNVEYKPGDTFFVPAGKQSAVKGKAEFILTKVG